MTQGDAASSNGKPGNPESASSSARDLSVLLQMAPVDAASHAELFETIYAELRQLAGKLMTRERPDHSMRPTILVHEAWLRLGAGAEVGWQGKAHFFGAAGEAMRRILVEHARRRGRRKHGGGVRRLPIDAVELARDDDPEAVLQVDEALTRLEQLDGRLAQVVRLRFWVGLDEQEVAELLQVSYRTVRRDWKLARAWLTRELEG